jgi:hypothetical protein
MASELSDKYVTVSHVGFPLPLVSKVESSRVAEGTGRGESDAKARHLHSTRKTTPRIRTALFTYFTRIACTQTGD